MEHAGNPHGKKRDINFPSYMHRGLDCRVAIAVMLCDSSLGSVHAEQESFFALCLQLMPRRSCWSCSFPSTPEHRPFGLDELQAPRPLQRTAPRHFPSASQGDLA